MKFELEQRLRNEARALRESGVYRWADRLIANGLDPEKWSHETEAELASPRSPSLDRARELLRSSEAASEPLKALMGERPELYFSTRTRLASDDEIFGYRASDLGLKSFDESSNTIECVWTTGARVMRSDGIGLYYEDLDVTPKSVRLGRLNAGASFLNSHRSDDLDQVIGSVVQKSARVGGGVGRCRLLLSRASSCASTVQNIKDGVVRNCSVGYIIHASTWLEGDDGGLPVCRVTDWEPYEISAVAIPADPGAQFRQSETESNPAAAARARMRARAAQLGLNVG